MSQTDRPQGRAYHKGPVVMRGAQVPSSTTDQRLLDSRGTADWVHTDPWRVPVSYTHLTLPTNREV